jgi:hypothetical protein
MIQLSHFEDKETETHGNDSHMEHIEQIMRKHLQA